MTKKIQIVLQLAGTLVGVVMGFVAYFVGVVVGVVWMAGKTGFRDATRVSPSPTPTQAT